MITDDAHLNSPLHVCSCVCVCACVYHVCPLACCPQSLILWFHKDEQELQPFQRETHSNKHLRRPFVLEIMVEMYAACMYMIQIRSRPAEGHVSKSQQTLSSFHTAHIRTVQYSFLDSQVSLSTVVSPCGHCRVGRRGPEAASVYHRMLHPRFPVLQPNCEKVQRGSTAFRPNKFNLCMFLLKALS